MVPAHSGIFMSRPGFVEIPQPSTAVQAQRKAQWNEVRPAETADFYTIGYSGRSITDFLAALADHGIQTVLDIRHSAHSVHKPSFSKQNLEGSLKDAGIYYRHVPELGVPREVRLLAIDDGGRDSIWAWYDQYVVGRYIRGNLHRFLNANEHPVAMMCLELDPTSCHRHRLALRLERLGLRSHDL
jgi:uncharacterized protein (DUF488 family)